MTTESSRLEPTDPERRRRPLIEQDGLLITSSTEPLTAEKVRELRLADQR